MPGSIEYCQYVYDCEFLSFNTFFLLNDSASDIDAFSCHSRAKHSIWRENETMYEVAEKNSVRVEKSMFCI